MRFPSEYTEGSTPVPYIRSNNPGAQWYFHTQGETMSWTVDCPLGHKLDILNNVEVILLVNEKYPSSSGRYFYIPSLDSPLFYSLRAAARWAASYEAVTEQGDDTEQDEVA